jgi:hypothetical protein
VSKADYLIIGGVMIALCGISAIHWPSAVIIGGVLLVTFGILTDRKKT